MSTRPRAKYILRSLEVHWTGLATISLVARACSGRCQLFSVTQVGA